MRNIDNQTWHPDLLTLALKSQKKHTHTALVRGTTNYVTKREENLFGPRYARYYFVVLFESLWSHLKPGKSGGEGGGK